MSMDDSRRDALRRLGFVAAAGGLGSVTAALAMKSGPAASQGCGGCRQPGAKCKIWRDGLCKKGKRVKP